MIRNPFNKGYGCNFMFCILIQFFVQLIFYQTFVAIGLHEEGLRPLLIEQAEKQGYSYDIKTEEFTPKLKEKDQELAQKDAFFTTEGF